MARDIHALRAAGAHGLVFGALTPDGAIDGALMRQLIDLARPLPVTCHKAIDDARDQLEALDTLLALGVDRVLTSGGAATAAEGVSTIAEMVRRVGPALMIMAGGGVRAHNVADLVRATGVHEVHATLLPTTVPSSTGADVASDEVLAWPSQIAQFVAALPRA